MQSNRTSSIRSLTALLLAAGLVVLLAPQPVQGQSPEPELRGIQVEQFEPLPDQYTNVLNVATTDVIPHMAFSLGALIEYVQSPLRLVSVGGDTEVDELAVIDSQIKGELWAGVGFFDIVDLGVVVPLVLTQSGEAPLAVSQQDAITGFALQDVRVVPRGKLLPREMAGGFGVGVEVPISLPTGDERTFNGEGTVRVEPRLVLDYRHDSGLTVAANAGYLMRERREVLNIVNDDVVRWAVAAAVPLGVPGLQLLGSVYGSVQTEDSRDPRNLAQADEALKSSPVEAVGAVRFTTPFGLHATLGGGRGLNGAVGSPELRVFASVGFLPLDDDADDDGFVDAEDACPERAEDKDAFQDEDGCPDPDNDGDEVADLSDQCPLEPEDRDQFQDDDGCPDPDNDQDGVADAVDRCPVDAEDPDAFQDDDGCPDLDNDDDGVADASDACPLVAEDEDGFEDENGCPDPDNDQDGIADAQDQCPLEAEVLNGVDDEDGCPDEGESRVVITEQKIEILDRVYFDTDKTTINPVSFNILDQVASVLRTNPQITKVRVEGHTDDQGKPKHNQALSDGRAAAVVEYLVGKGIDPARLEAKGYGMNKPIDNSKTAEGRAANRRVEFTILEISGAPLETPY